MSHSFTGQDDFRIWYSHEIHLMLETQMIAGISPMIINAQNVPGDSAQDPKIEEARDGIIKVVLRP